MKARSLDYALYEAVRNERQSTAQDLIKAGANPNGFIDSDGLSCTHWAVKKTNNVILRALIKAGADLTLKDKQNDTPISLGTKEHHYFYSWETVKTIASEVNNKVNGNYTGHKAALLCALINNHAVGTDLLLQAGTPLKISVNPNYDNAEYKKYHGCTPLHIAVIQNNPGLIKKLLEYSADPNYTLEGKETPMEFAARLKHWDCVKAFANFNKELSGKAIYEKLITVLNLTVSEYAKIVPYKEQVFAYMLQISNKADRMKAFEKAVNAKCPLGYFFWWKRGSEPTSLTRGMLKRIQDQIKVEKLSEPVKVEEKRMQTTAKVMTAVAVVPSAPAMDMQFQSELLKSTQNLVPVYMQSNTFTNQMNSLPNVKELPTLPTKQNEKKVAVAGM